MTQSLHEVVEKEICFVFIANYLLEFHCGKNVCVQLKGNIGRASEWYIDMFSTLVENITTSYPKQDTQLQLLGLEPDFPPFSRITLKVIV